ncbi:MULTISPECIES: LPO_1073/Vpar_1526 family protein [Bacillus cereus group]|uniref:LPO_1073/Vpar_1526 family protein n=1 Tax=Bacillus cereus group TaxID=86661 RepID=UPI001AEEC4DF|nr:MULTISPECIES: LPO_1073/Vpar_1526 family protein [Bacillus cereus group]QTR81830.1 hypothetical protein JC777_14775 [Bacillus cytotoxicus]QTR85567.1 hypothetical protein JC774_13280 [Bacillus cytotoxicus]HDR4573107.1 hypothetical protein [Bacillus cytotoxicus]HDR4589141.1 hypothetical protein [Bacillus cytotoxicus]HDR7310296.1 hypothetical protein [Bacillus cytotoxicus]
MFKRLRFKQKGEEGSTNIQALNYNAGISYEDARNIALDVFKNNFYELSATAAEVASARAEEITEIYLQELREKKPEAVSNVNDPDIQFALFNAQMQYARNDDKELGEVLVDLLVERTEVKERDFKQIVLNESIEVLSKLNKEQIDILTLVFCLRSIRMPHITSLLELKKYLEDTIDPLFTKNALKGSHLLHLEYCGCLNVERLGSSNLHKLFSDTYDGLFCKGFTLDEFKNQFDHISEDAKKRLLRSSLHDKTNTLLQFNAMSAANLEWLGEELGLTPVDIINLKNSFENNKMSENQVEEVLKNLYPNYTMLVELWEKTDLKSSNLTTVGIAIAYTNLKRFIDLPVDLNEWFKQ